MTGINLLNPYPIRILRPGIMGVEITTDLACGIE
jgi:hypothetical protein